DFHAAMRDGRSARRKPSGLVQDRDGQQQRQGRDGEKTQTLHGRLLVQLAWRLLRQVWESTPVGRRVARPRSLWNASGKANSVPAGCQRCEIRANRSQLKWQQTLPHREDFLQEREARPGAARFYNLQSFIYKSGSISIFRPSRTLCQASLVECITPS